MIQRGLEVQFFAVGKIDEVLVGTEGNAVNAVFSCQDGTTISLSMPMELAKKLRADIASAIRGTAGPIPGR
jgi:hypothetical protein